MFARQFFRVTVRHKTCVSLSPSAQSLRAERTHPLPTRGPTRLVAFLSRAAIWGESKGWILKIAIFLVADCAGTARARGQKTIQRPCGVRLQNFKAMFFPPLSPNPSPPPPGRKGELNNPIWPTLCAGWRSRATCNIQTCREPRECESTLTLPVFTLKVGRAP